MPNFVESLLCSRLFHFIFVCFFAVICWCLLCVNENIILNFPPHRFSLKAPYRFSPLQKLLPSPQCEISHLIAISRHTSRFPTAKNIELFSDFQSKLSNTSFSPSYWWLQSWTSNFSLDTAGELSNAGVMEAISIGERYRRRYVGFFDTYSPNLFQVNSTYKNRTFETAQAFMTGVFGERYKSEFEITRNPVDDTLLRFFDDCPKYERNKEEKVSPILEEMNTRSEFVELVERVNARLGTDLLDWTDINTLWKICSMEYITTQSTLVCSVFSDQDSQLMEYFHDHRAYLTKSSGFSINVKMSCSLLKHIVAQLKLAAHGDGKKAHLYFAHSETLIPLLALLNISTHSLVYGNEYKLADRGYMYGLLVPMGANLAFNLIRCVHGDLLLTIELNEELVLFGKDLKKSVLLSEFFELSNSLISDCDPESFCSIPVSD